MSRVFVVHDMQQIAQFVYQDYTLRLAALQQQIQQVSLCMAPGGANNIMNYNIMNYLSFQRQKEATPPDQKEVTPPVEGQTEVTPPMEGQSEATPPMEVQKEATPPIEDEREDSPPMEGQSEATPPMEVQKEATPPIEDEREDPPPMEGQKEVTPPVEVDDHVTVEDGPPIADEGEVVMSEPLANPNNKQGDSPEPSETMDTNSN